MNLENTLRYKYPLYKSHFYFKDEAGNNWINIYFTDNNYSNIEELEILDFYYANNVLIDLLEYGDATILSQYQNDIIDYLAFLMHIQILSYNIFLKKKSIVDTLESDKAIKASLGIWWPSDDENYQAKLKEFNDYVLEFKAKKDQSLNCKSKEEFIFYYTNVLLPRLKELS